MKAQKSEVDARFVPARMFSPSVSGSDDASSQFSCFHFCESAALSHATSWAGVAARLASPIRRLNRAN